MGRTPQEKAKIEHRRMRVAELYLKGWTQVAIARELGVSQATVSGDIKANRKEWRTQRLDNMEELALEEQKRLLQIEREAWSGWERSQQPVETTRITQRNGEKTAEKKIRQQAGDPRFLKILLEAKQKRCDLLQLNGAPAVDEEARRKQDLLNWDVLFEEADRAMNEPDPVERALAEVRKRKED